MQIFSACVVHMGSNSMAFFLLNDSTGISKESPLKIFGSKKIQVNILWRGA
jgi:hypothetical protein